MSNNKQFPLDTKEHCIYYLWRIISSCELCMDSFKNFNKETEEILQEYKGKDKIPYYIYTSISNKTSNVMCYLLNLLGDCQTTSISYFKYRKQAQKLINRGNTDIKIIPIKEDALVNKLLIEFNRQRNWQNHVPESILLSELDLLQQGKIRFDLDPVRILHYNYVSYDYFEDLYNGNKHFCENARIIIVCRGIKKFFMNLLLYRTNQNQSMPSIENAKRRILRQESAFKYGVFNCKFGVFHIEFSSDF